MAATDNSKKSFWKRGGGNTKLPGRAQQVYKTHEPSPETIPHPQLFNPVGLRPRSKTFEEYEKETNDAWDDREEDLSDLSLPAELDFPKSDSDGSGRDGDRKRVNSKGKSDLRSFFTEVVKPRTAGSPLGRRRGHGGRHRTSSAPDKSPSPPPYHSRPFQDDIFDPPDRETMKLQKFGKLLAGPNTSLDELRKLSWSGIPPPVRATTWQLLCGYLPANIDRREEILQRKRQEYRNFILQYYPMRDDPLHIDTFRQIHIDVPRMNPNVPLFQQQIVQECFERILFIWSMRHPASGYVQGINDLVTPFFVVYLSYYISGDKNPETYDISQLAKATLGMIEADCFWCLQHLLEGIQDNYTLAQPGVQTKIMALKDLITRLDGSLGAHLKKNSVEFIQFAFRWMNNLLMREFPLRCVIRLWDSYLSENDGFATFHVYVCTALLARFSEEIKKKDDFQDIIVFLQNLPTSKWTNDDIELILAEAYQLKFMFADAPGAWARPRSSNNWSRSQSIYKPRSGNETTHVARLGARKLTMSYCKRDGKDISVFVTKEDSKKAEVVSTLAEEEEYGITLPNGELNWDCPCLGGMAYGPCGQEFRDAFSCFHYSEEEEKGSDCIPQFKGMQECFQKYPEIYSKYTQDDDEEDEEEEETGNELVAERTDSKSSSQTTTSEGTTS